MLTCRNIFKILNLRITEENIKFCRRVGDRGSEARPLIVGLFNTRDRALLLSLDTRDTEVSRVNFGPDLTKEQRKEESDMKKEMEEKNKALSADEKAKNLAWRMVGPRGERRLAKGTAREQENIRGGSSRGAMSRGIFSRGPRQLPPRVSSERGVGRITTRSRRGGMLGRNHDQESSRGEEEDEIFMDALSGSNRERLGNKRGREVDGEGEMDSSEPPPKH